MNDSFENKVHCAAVAGWWTLLIALIVFLLAWFAYLTLLSAQPAWILPLIGPDVTWAKLATISLWFFACMKFFLLLWALALVWLTLWAKQLRKR